MTGLALDVVVMDIATALNVVVMDILIILNPVIPALEKAKYLSKKPYTMTTHTAKEKVKYLILVTSWILGYIN